MRACLVEGCPNLTHRTRCAEHQRQRDRQRNADPRRLALYTPEWEAESRAIRQAEPWCRRCGAAATTVDHPTRAPLCRPCHGRLEAERRGAGHILPSIG